MHIRTDLALERAEINKNIEGVSAEEEQFGDIKVSRMEILTERASETLCKPCGKYITIEVPSFSSSGGLSKNAVYRLAAELTRLLPKKCNSVLVAGLGNNEITPDALGPKTAERIIATRHISKELAEEIGLNKLFPVSVLAPGVLGQTGIESAEIIMGTADRIKPDAVIVIDALAARDIKRLGTTIQLTDTGIRPGAGIGNRRQIIDKDMIGRTVIAVGVPTVVDIKTLLSDAGGRSEGLPDMVVTPKEVDMMIDRAAELLAVGINLTLQKSLSLDDIMSLI